MANQDMTLEEYQSRYAACKEVLKQYLQYAHGRDIVIWGTRENGRIAKEALEALGRESKFFVSSRPRTNTWYGLPLHHADVLDVKKHYVIRTTYAAEVVNLLRKAGFKLWSDELLVVSKWRDDMQYCGRFVGRGNCEYKNLFATNNGWMIKCLGKYCSLDSTVRIVPNHPLDYVTTNGILYHPEVSPLREKFQTTINKMGKPIHFGEEPPEGLVEIGNDVWLGENVVILPGVKIGDGAVIGAGAIVTKDVKPYAIMGGVPARLIRYRFSEEMIGAFLRIKWWDWPIEKIEENLELFYYPELFCETFDAEYKSAVEAEKDTR